MKHLHLGTVVQSYSDRASEYDRESNLQSCWGLLAGQCLKAIHLRSSYQVIVDVGCGTGHALKHFISQASAGAQFVGVEPAHNMRRRADELLREFQNVRIVDGRFEALPIETATVDYILSILAFHWTTNLRQSISELRRVLKPTGEMDLYFTGRNTGREFTQKTTPIFQKYLGQTLLLQSARLRRHLTRVSALSAFQEMFPGERLTVSESFETYYAELDDHWSWWTSRAAGHFAMLPPEQRDECDDAIRNAIASLTTSQGIPYTVHLLHVRLNP